MKNKPEAVETEAEELLFYSDKERDAALGTIGHLRIDFGRSGEEFNCTWFDHANSEKNDSHFKESFDMFIDDLRTGVLKSRAGMPEQSFLYGGLLGLPGPVGQVRILYPLYAGGR